MAYIDFMQNDSDQTKIGPRARVKPEYVLIGALLLLGAVAVPAMANLYLVQSLALSICTGLNIL